MKNKGITLIALVITIIIMLILAGIVLTLTIGDSGIIEKSLEANLKYKNAENKEEISIANYENVIEQYINNTTRENDKKGTIYKVGTYTSTSVSRGGDIVPRMQTANTIQINIKEKYQNYQELTIDNFLATDVMDFSATDTTSSYTTYGCHSTRIENYDNVEGILTIIKPFGWRDCVSDSLDACYLGTTTIYIIENSEIIDLE